MGFDRMRLPARGRAPGTWVLLLGMGLLGSEGAAAARPDEGLAAVQRAALAYAGLNQGATNRLVARQHLAALLPQVRLTLGKGWQLNATGRPLDGLTAAVPDDEHTSYALSASWDLARLLVPREALQLYHTEPRRAQQRLELLARVAGLVAARCHLLKVDVLRPSEQERVAELEAALDLLTGGVALPAVTPMTGCPAVPRFTVAVPHRTAGPRRHGAGRHSSASSAELADEGEEDDRLPPPTAGSPEGAEYGE